ncbi:non-ribosomal peptide synthetase [Sphaerisporangium rhizosphaerae]|uniref:Amino acid adenylation domain-containing protein n=1 Tax=Sphaerisporangium rhizosphaerae TaxID=2269375 RepID=A0ABW2PBQ4_9ACTN
MPRTPVDTHPPASFAQHGIWITERTGAAGDVYRMPLVVTFGGGLDVEAMRGACQAVLARHPVLATVPVERDGEVRLVPADVPPSVDLHDLSAEAGGDPDAAVRAHVERAFDLDRGPLADFAVLTLSPVRHVLVFTAHHLVFDGMSKDVLVRDLAACYRERVTGAPAGLPVLTGSYARYVEEEREEVAASRDEAAAFWRSRWSDPREPILPGPARAVRAAEPGETIEVVLGDIARAATALGVTDFEFLLAALHALLRRYGNEQVVVAVDMSTRTAGTRDLVGLFVNELPVVTRPALDMTFADFAGAVRDELRQVYRFRRVPLTQAVGGIAPRAALAPVSLSYRERDPDPVFPGLDVAVEWTVFSGAARNTLHIQAVGSSAGLTLGLQFSPDAVAPRTVQALAGHLRTVIESLADRPDLRVGDLPVLTPQEREDLEGWNATRRTFPGLTVTELFERRARAAPDAVAVVSGDREVTYAELDEAAGRLAGALRERGMGPGEVVALHLERSPEMVAGVLAVLKAGAAYLPLDPAYPAERLAFVLRDARVSLVLAPERLGGPPCVTGAPDLSGVIGPPNEHDTPNTPNGENAPNGRYTSNTPNGHDTPNGRYTSITSDPSETSAGDPPQPLGDTGAPMPVPVLELGELASWPGAAGPVNLASPASGDLAYVIYTSGSTGRPKGVEVEHRSLTNLLLAMRDELGAGDGDVWLGLTTLAFDISALELLLPLITGSRVVVVPEASTRDGAALRRLIEAESVTHAQATPSSWRLLLDAGFDAPGLVALSGGEPLPLPLARELRDRVGRLVNVYGPTETTVWSSIAEIPQAPAEVTIGGPLANTTIRLLDERLAQVPVGVPGEICIGGDGVARGYRDRPELTAARFPQDPHGPPEARLYRTGDLGRRRPDGLIDFLGRADSQVKIRGHRVELGEIEARLLEHPLVAEAAVVLREDEQRLVAYVVPKTAPSAPSNASDASTASDTSTPSDQSAPSAPSALSDASVPPAPSDPETASDPDTASGPEMSARLREHLARVLPGVMVPGVFVELERLPLTPARKLDRAALPDPPSRTAPQSPPPVGTDPLVAEVTRIWEEVLRFDGIQPDEDLFELGGHSLTVTQIASRIRKHLGVDVDLDVFFDTPTIDGVVHAIRSSGQEMT